MQPTSMISALKMCEVEARQIIDMMGITCAYRKVKIFQILVDLTTN